MNDLAFYFAEGWHHIVSKDALDHQLFILALSAIYLARDWRKILILVTAFTIGHSLTLALSVYDIVRLSSKWVEFLIPCTIIITAVFNLIKGESGTKKIQLNYLAALFFGLIHGLGFAGSIRFMLTKNESLGWNLFGFNLGLEAGQAMVVALIICLSYVATGIFKLRQMWWMIVLSSISLLWALIFAVQRWPW